MTSNDVFLGGGSSSGQFVEQSLPNIKADSGYKVRNDGNYKIPFLGQSTQVYIGQPLSDWILEGQDGAFTLLDTIYTAQNSFDIIYGYSNMGHQSNMAKRLGFDASRSNSIYRDNSNVTPKHYVIEFWIKFK